MVSGSVYVIVDGQQSPTQSWSSGQSSSNTSTGSLSLGQANPSVAIGQTISVSISGGTGYFISSNSNLGVVSATVNNNSLVLSGVSAGTASVTICASSGGCSTFSITVTGTSSSTAVITPTTNSSGDLLSTIQSMQNQLTQILSQIQIMATKLSQLAATVSPSASTTVVSSSGKYQFLNPLSIGDTGNDVTELQKRLKAEGIYSGPVNGSFGALTQEAVKKFQTLHGLSPLGNVGPATRAALNS